MSRAPFWSDDFDMDMLKIFPDITKMLGDAADRTLWTVGHETHGRLNHPTVWNTHGAYVWPQKPNLGRDKHGWFNIHGCVSNEPEIECTWLELLRDQWPHGYAFILLPMRSLFVAPPRHDFDTIMYDLRKWKVNPEAAQGAKLGVMAWFINATHKLEDELKRVTQ